MRQTLPASVFAANATMALNTVLNGVLHPG